MASAEEIATRCPLVAASRALTGTSSLLAVPVRPAGRTIGALGFGFRATGPVSAEIVLVAETLAELAGQALDRARRYEDEHAVAHQLQQALLPKVPAELPGAGIGVCYRPADRGRDVGGDWYDAFELPTGRIGFAVGDVVGHDLKAAVAMGRLQQLLRYVAVGGSRPAKVLQALDEACPAVTGTDFATLGYAEYDPAEAVITYACAGHPPPLLVADGRATYLNEGRSAPLGFQDGPRSEARLIVLSEAMLVWYSDGLIEKARRSRRSGPGPARRPRSRPLRHRRAAVVRIAAHRHDRWPAHQRRRCCGLPAPTGPNGQGCCRVSTGYASGTGPGRRGRQADRVQGSNRSAVTSVSAKQPGRSRGVAAIEKDGKVGHGQQAQAGPRFTGPLAGH